MSETAFEKNYPTLCRLLNGSAFDDEMKVASAMAPEEFKEALNSSRFKFNELFSLICGAMFPEWREIHGEDLEKNLAAVVETVGIETARSTYREKLLIRDAKALEDVRYEIAVTAKACAVLDQGSVRLEWPIQDVAKDPAHLKNSDIFGTFEKQPVRIEITVLHEKRPDSIDYDLMKYVEDVAIGSGFRMTLRSVIKDQKAAESVRGLVEQLHAHHVRSNGSSVEVMGVRFEWSGGVYISRQGASPIERIRFYSAGDVRGGPTTREITHLGSVRPVTPRYIKEDYPNPKRVFDIFDTPDAPKKEPVSKKVRDMLEGKLEQCEPGVINIVAFGNPLPMHDEEVANALRGAPIPFVSFSEDEHGIRQMGDVQVFRAPKAPFNSADQLASDDRAQFVDHFRDMSAVWHIRIGSYRKSEVFRNPNAKTAIPQALAAALAESAPSSEAKL